MAFNTFDDTVDFLKEFSTRYPLKRARIVKTDDGADIQYYIFNNNPAVWDFEWVTVKTVTLDQLETLLTRLDSILTKANQFRNLVRNTLTGVLESI